MTRAQRLRRVVSWALLGGALARLFVLGEQQSWHVVGPVAARMTGLALLAWFLHLVLHELGHLAMSRLARFQVDRVSVGPIEWSARDRRWSWSGLSLRGALSTLPIGLDDLRGRLRLVAMGGPLASAAATAGLFVAWRAQGQAITSPLGVGFVIGGLVLVSSLTPGRFRQATATAGNDLDQMIGGRAVLAHWVFLGVVQGVLSGRRPRELTDAHDLDALLPRDNEPPAAITLLAANRHLERGDWARAKALLLAATARAGEAPSWVHTDVFHQLGAISALQEQDLERARSCLEEVRRHQTLPWYAHLLEACGAHARDDHVMATKRVEQWLAEAAAVPQGRLACGGNEWILDRLRPGWRAPTP